MINKIIHFSDLHIRLFKDHDLYREIMTNALSQWKKEKPDRIVFTGDLVHSKNQMTPELINFVVWILGECSKICKTVLIIGNHDFLESNLNRVDALSPIIDSLENNNIDYIEVKGAIETRRKNIDKYKSGKTRVIFLNSKFNGTGINLQESSGIIVYHEMNDETLAQIIGRANRLGRKEPLEVHHLQIFQHYLFHHKNSYPMYEYLLMHQY